MPKKKFILTLFISLILIFPPLRIAQASTVDTMAAGDYLKSVIEFIHKEYQPGVPGNYLIDGALNGMFDRLDVYTTLYSPEETEAFLSELEGDYSGIGIVLGKIGMFITVNDVLPDSPAAESGILAGDRIIGADGTDFIGIDLEKASSLLRGAEDTETDLIIFRPQYDVLTIKCRRAKIGLSPFEYKIKDGVAYIRMHSFSMNAGKYFDKILAELDKHNITRMILDLRNNPGGELSAAVAMAQRLVPRGLITSLDFRSPERMDEKFYSTLDEKKYKLAVLVNGLSASASEILAGAIQDTKAGVLIGAKTYGKSKVQSLIPLLNPEAFTYYKNMLQTEIIDAYELLNKYDIAPADEDIIGWAKITTGEYFTPNGRSIDKVGLTPDYAVSDYEPVNRIDIRNINKFMRTVKPNLDDESPDVKSAEEILKLLDYDVDDPDLLLDEKTFEAIKKFQAEHGLYPYGTLDYITQQTLENELDKSILKIDTQYVKALEILGKD